MALDDVGSASGLARMLCACCGMETLHSFNRCVQCGTVIVFPSEQKTTRLSQVARKVSDAMSRGRPTAYDPKYCEIASELREAGATDVEVAERLNCNAATLYRWQVKHPEFRRAFKGNRLAMLGRRVAR